MDIAGGREAMVKRGATIQNRLRQSQIAVEGRNEGRVLWLACRSRKAGRKAGRKDSRGTGRKECRKAVRKDGRKDNRKECRKAGRKDGRMVSHGGVAIEQRSQWRGRSRKTRIIDGKSQWRVGRMAPSMEVLQWKEGRNRTVSCSMEEAHVTSPMMQDSVS
ncbi:hypothetical protein BS50DRAFT_631945 [Corynespora cassiicola Philippines]|uniref:Uncharacterized protein n=1 Tax=Corynespora cassiicola Philippines TaxID=1448308 RepID=A0A2T2NX55_CORCC|nr:hypothetical protein BS50DRAFT_631945 [Corynespora cassiicola Philippines]